MRLFCLLFVGSLFEKGTGNILNESSNAVFTENVIQGGSNLFPEETKITYLIPEKKKVDYFIKISGLKDDQELSAALLGINKINNIIASYAIDPMDLKSRDNLIF